MAISTAPRCEIRGLVMHVYPDGIKAYGHERHIVYVGRRGKPVRKLQGRLGTAVPVIGGLGPLPAWGAGRFSADSPLGCAGQSCGKTGSTPAREPVENIRRLRRQQPSVKI